MVGLTPNFEEERFRIETVFSARRGLHCKIPAIMTRASGRVKTLADQSFGVRGPKLFNELPKSLRTTEMSLDTFKRRLDEFLSYIPDQPFLLGYHQRAASNCLWDQIQQLKREGVFCSL